MKCEEIAELFAERVKGLRMTRGLSMSRLAENMGTSNQNVSRWESGDYIPTAESIILLSKYFRVSSDFLLGLKDTMD